MLWIAIKGGALLNNVRSEGGMTALMTAAWHGHAECAAALLQSGAELEATNSQDALTRNALEYAERHGRAHPIYAALGGAAPVASCFSPVKDGELDESLTEADYAAL